MTKRKIFILITAVALALYGVSVYVALESCENYYRELSNINKNELYDRVDDYLDYYQSELNRGSKRTIGAVLSDLMYQFNNMARMSRLKKFYIVITYNERNIEPKSYIHFTFPEKKYDGIKEPFYVDMDEYLTDEVKSQIKDFVKATKNEHFSIDYAELYQNGDEYIPVRIRLVDVVGYSKGARLPQKQKYIVLSDYSPNVICDSTAEGEYIYSYGYYFYDLAFSEKEDEYNKYMFEELKSKRAGYEDDGSKSLTYHDVSKKVGFKNAISGVSNRGRTINGENMRIKIATVTDCREEALNSNEFGGLFGNLTLLYLLVYLLVIIFTMRLHTKNQRINEAKQVFVSAAAHELKTPISVIQNQCECVIENIAPEKNDAYIKSVYDESKRMGDVVSTMLWYNRLSTENKVAKTRCSLSDLVRKEVMKYEAFALSKSVTVETDTADEIYKYCDETLITMAVDNYLSNAIKYAKGEKKVKVSLKMDSAENRPTLIVFNTGDTIPDEHRDKIWDVFWRADKVRNSSDNSTGMGLAICKHIFRLHKYKYGFRNKENGVEFYFVTK